jgi:hypothetical protein
MNRNAANPIRRFSVPKTKSNIRAWVCGGIAGFFFFWSGNLYGDDRISRWVVNLLIFAGSSFSSLAVRQVLINFGKSRHANMAAAGVIAAFSISILTVIFIRHPQPNPEPSPSELTTKPAQPIDYIEGTTFTYAMLKDALPFGYVLFYWRDGEIRSWIPHPDSRLEWNVDWNRVRITPDFAERTVVFEFPEIGFSYLQDGVRKPVGSGNRVTTRPITMRVGDLRGLQAIFHGKNEPTLCVATLSDNQRTPVFIVGFRIDDSNAK